MRKVFSRLVMALSLSLAALATTFQAQAQAQSDFPTRPIRVIICCAGVMENMARAMGEDMTPSLGQPLVFETKPGQSGNIAGDIVAKSKPDGYTVFLGTNSSHAANMSLFKSLPFDPNNDFVPVSGIAEQMIVLVTRPDSKITSVAELIKMAKGNPDQFSYGWASSSVRMASELLNQMTGIKVRGIPYKTNPQAATDLMGGQIDMMFADMTTAVPLIKAGKLRALGVSSRKRAPSLPDVPTVAEAGVPGYHLTGWIAAWAPAKTPKPIVERLQKAFHQSLTTERVKQAFAVTAADAMPLSSAELMAFQLAEQKKWAQMIKAAGIQPE